MKELETIRLILRQITAEDAADIFSNWTSDPEVAKYVTWLAHQTPEETQATVNRWLGAYHDAGCYRYGIVRKSDGTLIGMIDVVGYRDGEPVLGYCSGQAYWNRGYMSEAVEAVVQQLFADGYDAVIAEAIKENVGSSRVLLKNGFTQTGKHKTVLSLQKPDKVTVLSYRLACPKKQR